MRKRFAIAIGAVLVLAAVLNGPALTAPNTRYLGSYVWVRSEPWFGGFSGLEVDSDGGGFVAVSDRGQIVAGEFERQDGQISGIANLTAKPILNPNAKPPKPKARDAEGLAIDRQGGLYISFEGSHRVWRYSSFGGRAQPIPQHPDFADMQRNSSLEGLAVDAFGRLYTLPERSGASGRPFPIYRYDGKAWKIAMTLSRPDGFLPVGMDFGPQGRLYVLEREFKGIGFRSRVRRFEVGPSGLRQQELLLQTRVGQHDNLEGLSVWQDKAGQIRLTMLADDNFRFLQRTEFVEYVVAP